MEAWPGGHSAMDLEQEIDQLKVEMKELNTRQDRHDSEFRRALRFGAKSIVEMRRSNAEMRRSNAELRESIEQLREEGRALDRRLEKMNQEAVERGRALDARIDKLVLAVGELIRQQQSKNN